MFANTTMTLNERQSAGPTFIRASIKKVGTPGSFLKSSTLLQCQQNQFQKIQQNFFTLKHPKNSKQKQLLHKVHCNLKKSLNKKLLSLTPNNLRMILKQTTSICQLRLTSWKDLLSKHMFLKKKKMLKKWRQKNNF